MLIKFNRIKDYEGFAVNTIAGCSLVYTNKQI